MSVFIMWRRRFSRVAGGYRFTHIFVLDVCYRYYNIIQGPNCKWDNYYAAQVAGHSQVSMTVALGLALLWKLYVVRHTV
jgi:hypothetical protein